MARESIKAIELSGINHNVDKINSVDGMCEDIVNFRFKDGSWRTTGDGKKVFSFGDDTDGREYKNLFIHVNSYRHLLGTTRYDTLDEDGNVTDTKTVVEWFANIDNDGNFSAIEKQELFVINSDAKVIYAQGGHLLVIVNERSRVTLFFNSAKNVYSVQERVDADTARTHPLGRIEYRVKGRRSDGYSDSRQNGRQIMLYKYTKANAGGGDDVTSYPNYVSDSSKNYVREAYNQVIEQMKKEDCYCGPFLACIALRTVTGTWTYASAPTLIHPSFHGDEMHAHKSVYVSFRKYGENAQLKEKTTSPLYIVTSGQLFFNEEDIDGTDKIKKSIYILSQRFKENGFTRNTEVSEDIHDEDLVTVYSRGDLYESNVDPIKVPISYIDIDELPTIGDSWTMPVPGSSDDYAQDHVVWGKMNDLWLHVDGFNVSADQEMYDKIGVFITPVIGATEDGQLMLGETDPFGMDEDANAKNWEAEYTQKDRFRYGFNSMFNETLLPHKEAKNSSGEWVSGGTPYIFSRWTPRRTFRFDEADSQGGHIHNEDYISNKTFHLIRSYDIADFKEKIADGWFKVEFEPNRHPLTNLQAGEILPKDAFISSSFRSAEYAMMFNGRLHLANYKEDPGTPWGMQPFEDRDFSDGGILKLTEKGLNFSPDMAMPNAYGDTDVSPDDFSSFVSLYNSTRGNYASFAVAQLNQKKNFDGAAIVVDRDAQTSSNGYRLPLFIPYPSSEITKLDWYKNVMKVTSNESSEDKHYFKTEVDFNTDHNVMLHYPLKFAFEFPQIVEDEEKYVDDRDYTLVEGRLADPNVLYDDVNYEAQDRPNGLRVSEVDEPTVFTDENKYRIGQTEIVAIAANAMPVGQGQTGAVPLIVFTKDGVYGLFVDSSGEMAYRGSRILCRDVINNAMSAKATDAGVVFTTDRGIMQMVGNTAKEIGQAVEGDWCKYSQKEKGNIGYDRFADVGYHVDKLANLPKSSDVEVDFLEYIKHSIVDYIHNERELIVSNTLKYLYTDDPSVVGKRNGLIVYTDDMELNGKNVYNYSYVMNASGQWSRRDITADEYFNSFPTSYRLHDGVIYQIDENTEDDNGMFVLTREIKLDSIGFKSVGRVVARGFFETTGVERKNTTESDKTHDYYMRLIVYGSYDGRKWAMLGGNEKKGKFTDLGCVVSHPDIRYIRFLLCGSISANSRFDYFEVSSKNSLLSKKIR